MRHSWRFRASATAARRTRRSNAGEVPEGWEKDEKTLAHKDLDARWTKKNDQNYYGYKDHVVADLESKLIVRAEVTTASVHDSQSPRFAHAQGRSGNMGRQRLRRRELRRDSRSARVSPRTSARKARADMS